VNASAHENQEEPIGSHSKKIKNFEFSNKAQQEKQVNHSSGSKKSPLEMMTPLSSQTRAQNVHSKTLTINKNERTNFSST
jgi:hypothetical protein